MKSVSDATGNSLSCGMHWKSKNCEADQWRGREEQVSGNMDTQKRVHHLDLCGQ